MSYSGVICDYYTVFPKNANVTDAATGESTFYIPASAYMSTRKGQYCLISLADASFDRSNIDEPYFTSLKNVVSNNGSNKAVLGSFGITAENGNNVFHHTYTPNDVKYLISARPSQLVITNEQEDGTAVPMTFGYLTFKFEYLSKEAVAVLNDESEYTTF